MDIRSLLDSYAAYVLSADPVWATHEGLHTWDGTLGGSDPGHWTDHVAELRRFERQISAADQQDDLDVQVSLVDVRHRIAQAEYLSPWWRAPYWYVERIGRGVEGVLADTSTPPERRAELLFGRLHEVAGYLAGARRTLVPAEVPAAYRDNALRALPGVAALLDAAVAELPTPVSPTLLAMCAAAARRARAALAEHERLMTDLVPEGSWAAGADYVDHCLTGYHLLDLDHEALYEWGLEQVEADRRALGEHAARRDLDWQQQIAGIRERHTTPDRLVEDYRRYVEQCREHTVQEGLASLPDGERCELATVPPYLRAAAPMGFMQLAPAYSDSLTSYFRLTPIRTNADGTADPDHLRENCFALMRTICGHETYPGHHLQRVHHKMATASTTSIRRVFTSPLFVEGWGLYVEDLLQETGQISGSDTVLYKLRNSLWRSARVVMDTGLHTRGMSVAEAERYLMDVAALGQHIARGEVARYIRHDNPTYPSAYALGRARFHSMRGTWQRTSGGTLQEFHDKVLGFGSVPHRLVEERLFP